MNEYLKAFIFVAVFGLVILSITPIEAEYHIVDPLDPRIIAQQTRCAAYLSMTPTQTPNPVPTVTFTVTPTPNP